MTMTEISEACASGPSANTHLLHKPIDLIFNPFLAITRIEGNFLAYVCRVAWIVLVEAQNPIADPAATLLEDCSSAT